MPDGLEQPTARREIREPSPLDPVRRNWLLANTAQWVRTEETASNPDLWAIFSTPISRRRSVARSFASQVGGLNGVSGIWVTDLNKDLDVAVTLDDPELESRVRRAFIDLVCEQLDASEGELYVFPSDQVPSWAKNGESLI